MYYQYFKSFLYGCTCKNVYIITGPEFDEYTGKCIIIDKHLYRLKNSIARFYEYLIKHLHKMGFQSCKNNFDFWHHNKNDYYEYVAIYVNNIFLIYRN